ncbi:MAG TPA: class I SAM-dependent methyltransferase [Pirellulales bacterium]|nr:class I SAM-dependent methyltransferase [Pirellulales bacterium]
MKPGPIIRRAFGPWEHWATDVYRRCFVDLRQFTDDLTGTIQPALILDVGCGEGQSTEALASSFQGASIVGIDVTDRVGRLFRGDRQRVRFVRDRVGDFAGQNAHAFDLAVLCDVLHHVSAAHRPDFLGRIAECVRPGGWLVVKEWQPRCSLMHLLCFLGDRYLTGDRVSYAGQDELEALLNGVPSVTVVRTSSVRPWANNVALWARVCQH